MGQIGSITAAPAFEVCASSDSVNLYWFRALSRKLNHSAKDLRGTSLKAKTIETKRSRARADRECRTIRSRFRRGTWLFPARLLGPSCERCPTLGMTCFFAAPQEPGLSMMTRLGAGPCLQSSRVKSRFTAWCCGGLAQSRRAHSRPDRPTATASAFCVQCPPPPTRQGPCHVEVTNNRIHASSLN
jgi:hypothetical protein